MDKSINLNINYFFKKNKIKSNKLVWKLSKIKNKKIIISLFPLFLFFSIVILICY